MKTLCTVTAALFAAIALAGCSSLFGASKNSQPAVTVNADLYPANYRRQIVQLLTKVLTNRAEFQNALIAPPVLKPVAYSSNLHYVVCLQLNGRTGPKNKVVIYLSGEPTQYVDSTPQQCADAAYQPFPELARALPAK